MRTRPGPMLVLAGVVVVVSAALIMAVIQPANAEEICREVGRCPAPGTLAALRVLGWAQAAGVAGVLAGYVAGARDLPAGGTARPTGRRVVVGAAVTGLAAGVVFGPAALFALFLGAPALVTVAVLVGVLQAAAVTTLLADGGPTTRAAWAVGPVTSAVATAVTTTAVLSPEWWGADRLLSAAWVVPPLHGAVLAATVLAAVGPSAPRRAAGVAGLVAAAGLVVLITGQLDLSSASRPAAPVAARPVPPTTAPLPTVAPIPAPIPEAPPTTVEPAPVETDTPCDPAQLVWSATGWDAAMGARAGTLVARNGGPEPCFVEGRPAVEIGQNGRLLQLNVQHGYVWDPLQPGLDRLGLAPGGAGRIPLGWRMHSRTVEDETPQTLTVTMPGGVPTPVSLDVRDSPFDLLDGGTLTVGGWEPAAS